MLWTRAIPAGAGSPLSFHTCGTDVFAVEFICHSQPNLRSSIDPLDDGLNHGLHSKGKLSGKLVKLRRCADLFWQHHKTSSQKLLTIMMMTRMIMWRGGISDCLFFLFTLWSEKLFCTEWGTELFSSPILDLKMLDRLNISYSYIYWFLIQYTKSCHMRSVYLT